MQNTPLFWQIIYCVKIPIFILYYKQIIPAESGDYLLMRKLWNKAVLNPIS